MAEQLLPGQVISGRFRLERLLGQGGMGTVWQARHLSLETQIAIKFLNSDLSRRHDIIARFAREATSAARIRSPHVVSILDSGFTDDGLGFIAMELLRGDDLGRRLARFGTLTVGETALLVTQVARGLAKAHSVNVVHRDLKPENIFIVDEDDAFIVKILDFGIAKSIGTEASTHKTDTGQLLGTPLYMSPEQALGRALDSRSDLYSLAVVAYRCLAGRPPFTYPAVGELIVAVSTREPPPPSEFNPELSPAIDAWFAGALAKDPNARTCQTAQELSESFNRACGEALDSLLPSSDNMHTRPRSASYPPLVRTGSTEPALLSREEVATTVAAAHLSPTPQATAARKRLAQRWWPALVAALAVGVASSAFLGHNQRAEHGSAVVPLLNPALPPVAAAATSLAPEAPAPTATEETARPAPVSASSNQPRVDTPLAHATRATTPDRSVAASQSTIPSADKPTQVQSPRAPVETPAPVPATPTTAEPAAGAVEHPGRPQIDRTSPW